MSLAPQQPAWLERPPPVPPPVLTRLTPSTAGDDGGPVVLPRFIPAREAAAKAALDRGRLVHRLLESLPAIAPDDRRSAGARYLAAMANDWSEADRDALLDETLAILADPAFAAVFAPGSRAEVEIAGEVEGRLLSGRIDRMALTDAGVLLVDYKTNRPAPGGLADTPPTYVTQLALYRLIVGRLYPGRTVSAAILWTERPALMAIPSAALDAALESVATAMRAGLPSPVVPPDLPA